MQSHKNSTSNKELNRNVCSNMDILINSQSSFTTPSPSQPSLLDLNDYCLLEMLSQFNLKDLILISTICKRLQYNAQRLFPHRLKLWKDISDDDGNISEFLLSKIGPFLTEIEVNESSFSSVEDTIHLVRQNCMHLSSILLHHSVPTDLSILPKNIQHISIKFPENWTHTVGYLNGLKTFYNLQSLTLKFKAFTQIDSGFLTDLSSLKQLRLKNCSVEPTDLRMCLANSTTTLESLTISKCFPQLPNILIESVDQLIKLTELELQFNGGPSDFVNELSIFNRLTSLKLSNSATSIDVDQLFTALINNGKIHTLSMSSIDSKKSLSRATLQQLHRLTKLRRLSFHETDFVTDEFVMEITKCKSLTHFTYKQTYRPMLSFEAVLAAIALNGPKLERFHYIVYDDTISHQMQQSHVVRKQELLNACRKTDAFKRVIECRANISNKMTSVDFLFKIIQKKYN